MSCIHVGGRINAVICMAGPIFKIAAGDGRVYEFEFHHYLGPAVLNKGGEIRNKQPGEYSAFYPALEGWLNTGKRVCSRGYCVWRPKSTVLAGRRGRTNWFEADVFQDDRCCLFDDGGKR